MQRCSIPLITGAFFVLPAFSQSLHSRVLAPGTDGALPAPHGEVFFQPRDTESFTGLSDQEVAAAPALDFSAVDPHATLHFTEHTGGTWIRGRTYKARVHGEGFRYVPFLGSSSPRNWPVDLRLESATLAGEALELTAAATVTRDGNRFVLDRGPVDVLYDMSLESVEQSFTLDVAGRSGDLVLTLSVDSDLSARTMDAGFRFEGPHGGLDYGSAVAYDGSGSSIAVPSILAGNQLRLTVPAAFVARANGPLLVDPILTTFTVDAVSGDQRDIDVAYDVTNDAFTYVYEDRFSGNDVDLYSMTFNSGGTFMTGFYVDSSDDSWFDPSVANLNAANRNLFVASRYKASTGYFEIVGRIMDVSTQSLLPEFLIGEASASYDNFRPDVGGNSSGQAFTVFLVVWQRQFAGTSQPRYRTVIADGTMGPIQFFDNGAFNRTDVVISESTGDPATVNRWNVAYRSIDLGTGVVSIRGVQLNAGGAIAAGPSNIKTMPAGQSLFGLDVSEALSLDGLSPTYAVCYDRYPQAADDIYIVFCRNNAEVATRSLQVSEHANLSGEQYQPRLATTMEDFIVTYIEPYGVGDSHAYLTAFDLTEGSYLAISERRTLLGATNTDSSSVSAALASRFSGGLYTSRITASAWEHWNGMDYDAVSAIHIASNGFAQAFQYCYGNPNSTGDRGFITMYGDRSPTSTKQLVASALPPNTFGYFFCGDGFANVVGPGGSQGVLCVGGSIGRYSNAVASSGASGSLSLTIHPTMLPQPNGSVTALAGQIWQFQCWHRDAVAGTATSNFTNAVTILFR